MTRIFNINLNEAPESTSAKKLISQDDELLSKILTDLFRFTTPFRRVLEAYEALGLGEFTSDIFIKIVDGTQSSVDKKYWAVLNKQMDDTGVKHPILRNQVLSGAQEPLVAFNQACEEFRNVKPNYNSSGRYIERTKNAFLSISDIAFEDGELIVTDEQKEILMDKYCRIYVDGDKAHALYSAAELAAQALQALRSELKKLGFQYPEFDFIAGSGFSPDADVRNFIRVDSNGDFVVKPDAIPWALGYQAAREGMLR